jgi:hypothetical protein
MLKYAPRFGACDGGFITMADTVAFFDHGLAAPATPATVELFDPPMCCPTGLCGPALDQTLLDMNDLILKLKAQGVGVERYQMTSHPQAFLHNPDVMRLVREREMAALPICVVRGRVLKAGAYPTLAEVTAALDGVLE